MAVQEGHAIELRKEASTMALYVSICLLAALIAIPDGDSAEALTIVWGTTIGLALAHWFAFHLSARLVAAGSVRAHDAATAIAQLVGAGIVAGLATLVVLVVPESAELDVVRYLLAGLVGVVGYAAARASGASQGRSLAYAAITLVIAIAIAVVKNALLGH